MSDLPDALRDFVYDQILFRGAAAALDDLELGASRLGGPPDLPDGVEWPRAPSGRALPLLLQLRLAELPSGGAAARLPASGTLWFFAADAEEVPVDQHEVGWVPSAILHAPASTSLVRRALPPEASDELYWHLSTVSQLVDVRVNRAVEREEVFDELGLPLLQNLDAETRATVDGMQQPWDSEPVHVLFPVRLVGSMGIDPPEGWVSILELRSDWDLNMSWGDSAWISFRVPVEDLPLGRFDRTEAHVWIG